MPAFKSRIDRLERTFARTRIYTDDQWDGILLFHLAECLPENLAVMIRQSPIYPWAARWHARRAQEMCEWSDEQRRDAASRRVSDDFWESWCRMSIKAWTRHVRGIPCPFLMGDGELLLAESVSNSLQESSHSETSERSIR